MAEQADAPQVEDEELPPEEVEAEGLEPQTEETPDPEEQEPADEPDEGEPDELEFTFGDEAAPASRGNDSDLVKHLRQVAREQAEKLAKYERGEVPAQPQTVEVGPKPTLETCDYDEAKFEADLDTWKERKRQADEAQAQATKKGQAAQERFRSKLDTFVAGKTALKVQDFEIAETAVLSALSQVQQAVVIQAADDSARLVYALGRHPERLKALAAVEDPIEFTKALVKLEGQLKVTTRSRTPPEPDRQLRGSGQLSQRTDKTLERLEKEAERNNDRSKVIAYKRQLKASGRA